MYKVYKNTIRFLRGRCWSMMLQALCTMFHEEHAESHPTRQYTDSKIVVPIT